MAQLHSSERAHPARPARPAEAAALPGGTQLVGGVLCATLVLRMVQGAARYGRSKAAPSLPAACGRVEGLTQTGTCATGLPTPYLCGKPLS